jgi:predicted metal-dependent peptidase
MDVEMLRKEIRNIKLYTMRYFPFIAIPLSYVRIVATDNIPTAGVDERGTLAINPDWWAKLMDEQKRAVCIHEALHIVLLHPFRAKGFNRQIYNIAADGKVNWSLRGSEIDVEGLFPDAVTLKKIAEVVNIPVESLEKMSTEEIAGRLEDVAKELVVPCGGRGGCGEGANDLVEGEVEGEVVQEGERSVTEKRGKDLEKAWKEIAASALTYAKIAGRLPAGLERAVNEVLEVKPPWHVALRFGLRNHSKHDASFAYPSRRGDEYPGYYGYRYRVWCLIDCSGSISEDELRTFLGIVKHEARSADIYAIPWDAEAYEVLSAKNPAEVAGKVAPKMRGGGGTVIAPVLRKVLGLMRPGDAVIVLTDGEIADEKNDETKDLFARVAAKAGFAMVGYTHKPVDAPGFAVSYIDFRILGGGRNE